MTCKESFDDGTHVHRCVAEHVPEASLKLHSCGCGQRWNYAVNLGSGERHSTAEARIQEARRLLEDWLMYNAHGGLVEETREWLSTKETT